MSKGRPLGKRAPLPVNMAWFSLARRPMPRAFWIDVAREVRQRRVGQRDREKVALIVRRAEARWEGKS